jgi:hypothetical protein
MGAGQPQSVADEMDQQGAVVAIATHPAAVDRQGYFRHLFLPIGSASRSACPVFHPLQELIDFGRIIARKTGAMLRQWPLPADSRIVKRAEIIDPASQQFHILNSFRPYRSALWTSTIGSNRPGND